MTISFSVLSNLGNILKLKAVPLYENRVFSISNLEVYIDGDYIAIDDKKLKDENWEKIIESAYDEYRAKYSILFR